MKKIISKFLLRGLICSGFGPLVYGIVMFILYLCNVDTNLTGNQIFTGIISTYLIAFIVAGFSIIWEIEKLGLGFAILIHGSVLYICYLAMYLINNWISKDLTNILIFSAVFVGGYILTWLIIYIIEKQKAKKLTKTLK